jgi:hypothetical protein
MEYKKDEIVGYFQDCLSDYDKEWIEDNLDDLHHQIFNTDYFIIGTYQAKQWLGDMAFDVIDFIKEYEQSNFGEVFTDLSSPEKVVNMYAYILGEEIVADYIQSLEVTQ